MAFELAPISGISLSCACIGSWRHKESQYIEIHTLKWGRWATSFFEKSHDRTFDRIQFNHRSYLASVRSDKFRKYLRRRRKCANLRVPMRTSSKEPVRY